MSYVWQISSWTRVSRKPNRPRAHNWQFHCHNAWRDWGNYSWQCFNCWSQQAFPQTQPFWSNLPQPVSETEAITQYEEIQITGDNYVELGLKESEWLRQEKSLLWKCGHSQERKTLAHASLFGSADCIPLREHLWMGFSHVMSVWKLLNLLETFSDSSVCICPTESWRVSASLTHQGSCL